MTPARVLYLSALLDRRERERQVSIATAVRMGMNADEKAWPAWIADMMR